MPLHCRYRRLGCALAESSQVVPSHYRYSTVTAPLHCSYTAVTLRGVSSRGGALLPVAKRRRCLSSFPGACDTSTDDTHRRCRQREATTYCCVRTHHAVPLDRYHPLALTDQVPAARRRDDDAARAHLARAARGRPRLLPAGAFGQSVRASGEPRTTRHRIAE